MPRQPYTIIGTVYDEDGSAESGVSITAYNRTKDKWLIDSARVTTDTNGQYSIDIDQIAHASGTETGDNLYIIGKDSNGLRCFFIKHTAGEDRSAEGMDGYLIESEAPIGDGIIRSIIVSNEDDATTYYVKFECMKTGTTLMAPIYVAPEVGTISIPNVNIHYLKGVAILPNDPSAQKLHVTVNTGHVRMT